MKVIFTNIDNVFHLGDPIRTRRVIKFNEKKEAKYILSDMLDKTAIASFNKLMTDVSNVWIVTMSAWDEYLAPDDIRDVFEHAGFAYPHRVFDSLVKYAGVNTRRIMLWLRDNAEENEVNSFTVIDSKPTIGLFEKFCNEVNPEVGLSLSDVKIITTNFNHQEYRLASIWHTITTKGH